MFNSHAIELNWKLHKCTSKLYLRYVAVFKIDTIIVSVRKVTSHHSEVTHFYQRSLGEKVLEYVAIFWYKMCCKYFSDKEML